MSFELAVGNFSEIDWIVLLDLVKTWLPWCCYCQNGKKMFKNIELEHICRYQKSLRRARLSIL